MKKNTKKVEELRIKLNSGDSPKIIQTLSILRREKPFGGIIEILARFHSDSTETVVKDEIVRFFNDLKGQELTHEIINAINNSGKSTDTRRVLLSSCWQSGLDYSPYFEEFIGYSIDSDYLSAIESFTVLEQLIMDMDDDLRKNQAERINNSLNNQPSEKQKLLVELVNLLTH